MWCSSIRRESRKHCPLDMTWLSIIPIILSKSIKHFQCLSSSGTHSPIKNGKIRHSNIHWDADKLSFFSFDCNVSLVMIPDLSFSFVFCVVFFPAHAPVALLSYFFLPKILPATLKLLPLLVLVVMIFLPLSIFHVFFNYTCEYTHNVKCT